MSKTTADIDFREADPDGFYDGLYYLTPAEQLEALNDPAGFTVAERAEAFANGRTRYATAAEAAAAEAAAEGGSR